MNTMGREHIEPQEIPSRYDWQYLRDAEPACIEALATQKGLYFGEALGTFYESRFAMMLEQGGNGMRGHGRRHLRNIWNIQNRNCLWNMNAAA